MAIVLFLKSFPDHHGRPGMVGGSVPRATAGGRGSSSPTPPTADDPARALHFLQVDTKAFRDLDPAALRKVMTKHDHPRDVVNDPTGWSVHISNNGVAHAARIATPEQAAAMSVLPEMIRAAAWMSFAPDTEARHGYVGFHRFFHPIAVDENPYIGQITVRQAHGIRAFYHHEIKLIPTEFEVEASGAPGDAKASPADLSRLVQPDHMNVGQLREVFKVINGEAQLAKAATIPSGARWITVRPNGPGTDGHAVLIQPSSDGAFHVIGGAGGKLNYLKLTGVRSEEEYAQRQRDSAKARREQKQEQRKRDREAGLSNSKAAAVQQLRWTAQQARNDFITRVSTALAWKPEEVEFNHAAHQDKSPSDVAALEKQHFDRLLKTATTAVDAQRQRILSDSDLRAEVSQAIVPVAPPEDASAITVADLDPVEPNDRGLGFAPKYEARAVAAGASPAEMRAEAAEITAKPGEPPKDMGEKIKRARTIVAEPLTPGPDPTRRADAQAAMEVLRAQRELRAKLAKVSQRIKEIDKANSADEIQPQAFVIEVAGQQVDEEIRKGIEDDLRVAATRGFLEEAERQGAPQITRHVSVGSYNAINSLALAAGGSALMDRSVIDVLGQAGAAQALAHRLAQDLPDDQLQDVRTAMSRYHVQHYAEASQQALDDARRMQEEAAEIELGEAETGNDLAVAQELNQRRRELVRQSKTVLAQALGEMETNAALVTALEKPRRDRITVPMGDVAPSDAIPKLRAIGLDRGDYSIERAGRNTILVIKGDAIGKLTRSIDPDDVARVTRNLGIMQGHEDENGWLPKGVARRPEFRRDAPIGVAPRLARPFPEAPADVGQAVRDYIGGRAADGDAPADIMAGLLAEDVIQRSGDRNAFMAAVNEVAPLYDEKGKLIRAEQHADTFEQLADEFTTRAYGTKRAPIHKQKIDQNEATVEALHKTFAALPDAVLAFRPVGDLSDQDQGAIRNFFSREFASADPEAKAKRDRVAKLAGQEPEKETDGLFGRDINPEWTSWRHEHDAAQAEASAAEFTWPKYVKTMGSPQAAYQAMQDVLRGKAMEAFHQEYNRANPDRPLRLGRTVIRGDLNHLDAVDPKARERRQQEQAELADRLRNRVAGRYASGSVADKMAAAREAEEAAQQAQMGLFGDPAPAKRGDEALPEHDAPMGPGERATLGATVERSLAGIAERTGRMWKPGQPIKLWSPQMSGPFVKRQRAVKLIAQNRRVLLGMGVGCVDGASVLDDADGRGWTFEEWWASGESPRVMARREDGAFVDAQASFVYVKGVDEMFEVTLENGAAVTVTADHRFLTPDGWRRLRDIQPGTPLFLGAGSNVAYSRVASIRPVGRRTVFDVTVPEYQCYSANGILHHNSGKTSIMLSSFTHMKEEGQSKRGLFLVPSVVQGQFHGEAMTMLEPGKYQWHAQPGADREERLAAMKDGKNDFVVATHQSFRDDVLHIAAQHAGTTPAQVADEWAALPVEERSQRIKDALAREGIEFDHLAVDEGHNLLNRAGKDDSRMAAVIDGLSHHMGTYVSATADPIKNDPSEAFDTLRKMDPGRYRDRDAFMRKYGVDTEAARDGLRRELARHYYTASIPSGVRAERKQITVPLHPTDEARVKAIQEAAGQARIARMEGRVDIGAMKTLSPGSFADVPPERHEAVASRLQGAIGIMRDSAMRRAINGQGKVDALAREAGARKGRPGVVFARSLDQVEAIKQRLTAEGHRVVTMTGAHSAKDKDRIKREFTRGDHDVLVASDAGAVGANLQHGKWLAQMDTPMTAMLHAQRNGRIDRIGQTEDVELLDFLADHPEERMARDRLTRKYGLRDIVTSPLESLDDSGIAHQLVQVRAEARERDGQK